jgi:thiosulfate reductase cytochrome b subunit
MTTAATVPSTAAAPAPEPAPTRVYRHRLPVRAMHWINAVCLVVLLGSGLGIFNAHPALYWGVQSQGVEPWLEMRAENAAGGPIGVTEFAGTEWVTSGTLGLSTVDGRLTARGFPSWATIPGPQGLAMARTWHFFFAWLFAVNGLCYLAWTFASRHFQRDLVPTGAELRGIGRSIRDHLRLRHPTGEAARRYNVLQSLAYLAVVFVLLPLVVVTGLGMSPTANAALAGWIDVFGGRQSMRSLHFVCATLLVVFTAVHVAEVVLAGAWNEIRSMVTGWYVLPRDRKERA